MNILINYTAAPTIAAFMKSEAFFRIIAGPIGSGKTAGCIMELLRRACEQHKAPDGLRYTRFAIVRQTLKQLKDTVLKDIELWLKGLVAYKVQDQTVFVEFGDVRSEWLLIPLDSPDDQRRLLSMQLTGAWLSEAIEMEPDIVSPVLGRCGRYPGASIGGASWHGAIADTNMPIEGDPWHNLMEMNTPPDWRVWVQPGGLEEGAENLNWLLQTPASLKLPFDHPDRVALGKRYYERLVANNSPDWVMRYVHAKYGNDPSGSAVFRSTFTMGFHVIHAKPGEQDALIIAPGQPLIVVQDFGRNPCSLICQADHKGRGLVLEEIVSEDIGLELHITRNLRPALQKVRYLGRSFYLIGDPAGRQRSTSYEETSFDLLKRHGFNAYPAPTNDIDKRLRATEAMLLQQRDGGPALMIDGDKCPMLVRALQGRYRFAKRRNGQLAPVPEKLHPWSDLADDLQYFCLVLTGGMTGYIAGKLEQQRQAKLMPTGPRPRISARGWT